MDSLQRPYELYSTTPEKIARGLGSMRQHNEILLIDYSFSSVYILKALRVVKVKVRYMGG